jgi:hypothetical protein
MKVFIKKFPFLLESLFVSLVLLIVFQLFGEQQLYVFTNDSGAYLLNSIELKVPGDRTVFYSLWIWFLREIMGIQSLFPVVFLPFWMVVYGLILVVTHLMVRAQIRVNRIAVLTLLVVGIWISGAMWIVTQIMPDIFTSLLFLSWYLFTVSIKSNERQLAFFWGIIMVISCVMHNAHLLVIIGLFIMNILFNKVTINIRYKRIYNLIYVFPLVLVMGSNLIAGNGFSLSKNAPVFLVAKMAENGILKEYLDENCKTETTVLCQFKDSLPEHAWDYIWPSDGIHMKVGGWYHTDSLYRSILQGIIADRSLCGELLVASIKATFKQLTLIGVGDGIISISDNETIRKVLTSEYHYQFHSQGLEKKMNTNFSKLNRLINVVMISLLILLVVFVVWLKRLGENSSIFIEFSLMFIVFVVLQAFSTGALANILMRLNMRAVWFLTPLLLVLVIGEMFQVFYMIRIWFLKKYS